MRDGFSCGGFGLEWSVLWSNFMHWARQSQHPQKRAEGFVPSLNRGVSPRMRKAALEEARISVNIHPHWRHGQATFEDAKVNMLSLLGRRRAEQSLNPWHSPSRVSEGCQVPYAFFSS
jgi:hypothetical protein